MDSLAASSAPSTLIFLIRRGCECISYRKSFQSLLPGNVLTTLGQSQGQAVNPLSAFSEWLKSRGREGMNLDHGPLRLSHGVSDVRYSDSCQRGYAADRGLCRTSSNTSWSALAWRVVKKTAWPCTWTHTVHWESWHHLKNLWMGKVTFCTRDSNCYPPGRN